MTAPVVNITIPVFNRLLLTQKTLLALRKASREVPFCVTVVDNGSSPELRERLVEFHQSGIIDNLFLLPRNMGIACACNIGWQAVDAPYCMKLDNDVVMQRPDFLAHLFRLWAHGDPVSVLGPALLPERLRQNPGTIETPEGILGICTTNVPGGATLVPRAVSDVLGCWNEDYGLYGGEDGDYGLRMQCAGFAQYYYDDREVFRHEGEWDSREYVGTGLDKKAEHYRLFKDKAGGLGLFVLNSYLYDMCIRNWKVPRRWRIKDISGYDVALEEDPAYAPVREALRRSKQIVDGLINAGKKMEIFWNTAVIARMKRIWEDCGQGCGAVPAAKKAGASAAGPGPSGKARPPAACKRLPDGVE